jgi:hypothetical protein
VAVQLLALVVLAVRTATDDGGWLGDGGRVLQPVAVSGVGAASEAARRRRRARRLAGRRPALKT